MAYLKPDVLKKILQDRENQEEVSPEETRKIFEQQVADTFGKPLQSSG
jgi:hypothetical protein